jgi:hypothetical protein
MCTDMCGLSNGIRRGASAGVMLPRSVFPQSEDKLCRRMWSRGRHHHAGLRVPGCRLETLDKYTGTGNLETSDGACQRQPWRCVDEVVADCGAAQLAGTEFTAVALRATIGTADTVRRRLEIMPQHRRPRTSDRVSVGSHSGAYQPGLYAIGMRALWTLQAAEAGRFARDASLQDRHPNDVERWAEENSLEVRQGASRALIDQESSGSTSHRRQPARRQDARLGADDGPVEMPAGDTGRSRHWRYM